MSVYHRSVFNALQSHWHQWRVARDERLIAQWHSLLDPDQGAMNGWHERRVGRITRIRQWASTGSKAYVHWVSPSGLRSAAWFEAERARAGYCVVAHGRVGFGEHHRENVFYVDAGNAVFIPGRVYRAYRRATSRLGFDAGPSAGLLHVR